MKLEGNIVTVLREYRLTELADLLEQDKDEGQTRIGELSLDASDAWLAWAGAAIREMERRGCRTVQVFLLEQLCQQIESQRRLLQTRGWTIVSKSVSQRVGIWVPVGPNERPFVVGVQGRAPIRPNMSVFEISQEAFDRLFVPCVQNILDGQISDPVRQLFVATLGEALAGEQDATTLLLMLGSRVRGPEVFSSPSHLDEKLSGVIAESINQFPAQETELRDQFLRLWAWRLTNILFMLTGEPIRLGSWARSYGKLIRPEAVELMQSQALMSYGPQRAPKWPRGCSHSEAC